MSRFFASALIAAAVIAATISPTTAQTYGNGYNLPQGSYLQSCTDITMRGNRLRATCTQANGQTMRTSINANRCGGMDIINSNGALACGSTQYNYTNARAYGRRYRHYYYNNGVYMVPAGSYQASCNNVHMAGNGVLRATCSAPNGQSITSTLNVRACSNDIRNDNGYLRC